MPLGFERINTKTQPPNPSINFIKPLPRPPGLEDEFNKAHLFMSHIAAIAAPITKANHISVMSIEEFPPNREFWGRNFNAGECIQLVLKSPSTGQWLPFRFVQMVFMHELAHCKQMNHSRAFWAVRNAYSDELKILWSKGYTGEGLWGRGRSLYDGQLTGMELPAADGEMVGHLCGGSYRGVRGRGKRGKKDKPRETYAEKKQRRIKKKFGEGGAALGDDEETRRALEGKTVKGKPRVAGSNRGRELRAAAALARFGPGNAESPVKDEDSETEEESDFEEKNMGLQAKGANGEGVLDSEGNRLVRVCEGEDAQGDVDARREMEEIGSMHVVQPEKTFGATSTTRTYIKIEADDEVGTGRANGDTGADQATNGAKELSVSRQTGYGKNISRAESPVCDTASRFGEGSATEGMFTSNPEHSLALSGHANRDTSQHAEAHATKSAAICSICSLENDPDALTCLACAHVLYTDRLPSHWRCTSDACENSLYINSGDSGVCGICGTAKA